MLAAFLSVLVLVLHLLFILYVVFGGLLLWHWPKGVWIHLPAVCWAVLLELFGWICPLTPLENWLLARAGSQGYTGEFIPHYLLPLIYPGTWTRELAVASGFVVMAWNLLIYILVYRHRWRRR